MWEKNNLKAVKTKKVKTKKGELVEDEESKVVEGEHEEEEVAESEQDSEESDDSEGDSEDESECDSEEEKVDGEESDEKDPPAKPLDVDETTRNHNTFRKEVAFFNMMSGFAKQLKRQPRNYKSFFFILLVSFSIIIFFNVCAVKSL
jgi:hypothetical protein